MTLTDRRILLFPLLIVIGALISSTIHSSVPIIVAAEVGFIGMFFMRTAEQRKIVSNNIIISIIGVLIVCLLLAIYSHR